MQQIITSSAGARSQVVSVIDAVQNCSMAPSQGESTTDGIVSVRKRAVSQLQQLDTAALPGGPSMVDQLISAMDDSISADVSFMSWMGDIANGNASCNGNPMGDQNFVAGQQESQKADRDKATFAAQWQPVATRYGMGQTDIQSF